MFITKFNKCNGDTNIKVTAVIKLSKDTEIKAVNEKCITGCFRLPFANNELCKIEKVILKKNVEYLIDAESFYDFVANFEVDELNHLETIEKLIKIENQVGCALYFSENKTEKQQ